ncbi:ABC transporter permease [Dyella flava]|uniref:ABC transporter permease n=1 Tax=Dyella flava TaxID=1920170 RepID=A0ABS2K9P5_9GAMM|nr:FtsX-like permease family protein [Dyella flava]MBM7127028.1 ABC transporter permease [Dyella flava]GLQ50211.1 ABC transporter permease [Dyella flava]
MQIRPILAALRHHKAGSLLIALQVALTLAIVCNALFIIHGRLTHLSQPSGVDEDRLLVVENQWAGKPDAGHIGSMMSADLNFLRQMPGVSNAYATDAYPLRGGGMSYGIGLVPDKLKYAAESALYFADENGIDTLGLKLVAGRNFRADEIGQIDAHSPIEPAEAIITVDLAKALFHGQAAVGKVIYLSAKPTVIIGVVERMQIPWTYSDMAKWSGNSTLIPLRQLVDTFDYVVRTEPGQVDEIASRVRAALYAQNRMRVIDADGGVLTYAQVRAKAYKNDRGIAILMSAISLVLLAITGAGIVGLTSFWVGQRRKQIGVRRALGATRNDILSYFLTENLLIAVAGVTIGGVLAVALNFWLMKQFEIDRLAPGYVLAGVVALLVLGQAAVLAPALRASHVPPVEATRSV